MQCNAAPVDFPPTAQKSEMLKKVIVRGGKIATNDGQGSISVVSEDVIKSMRGKKQTRGSNYVSEAFINDSVAADTLLVRYQCSRFVERQVHFLFGCLLRWLHALTFQVSWCTETRQPNAQHMVWLLTCW
jgi:hypothetical protein